MIMAFFTENEKYLQKGDYRKDFNVNSISELISNIKVKENILIKDLHSENTIIDTNKITIIDIDNYNYLLTENIINKTLFDNEINYKTYKFFEKA